MNANSHARRSAAPEDRSSAEAPRSAPPAERRRGAAERAVVLCAAATSSNIAQWTRRPSSILFGIADRDDDNAGAGAGGGGGGRRRCDHTTNLNGDEGGAAAEGAAAEDCEEEEERSSAIFIGLPWQDPSSCRRCPRRPPTEARLMKLLNILSREARPFEKNVLDDRMDTSRTRTSASDQVIPLARRRRRAASNTRLVRWSELERCDRRERGALGDVAAARQAGGEAGGAQLFVRYTGAIFRCHGVLRGPPRAADVDEVGDFRAGSRSRSLKKERRIKVMTTAEDPEKKADDEQAWRQSQLASAQEARRQKDVDRRAHRGLPRG